MSDWFFMVGEPLEAAESQQVRDYLRGLGILDETPVECVSDWQGARRVIDNPEWDRRWWDAEQAERQRLQDRVRRSLLDEVGPWDEGYRCYWVDSDWCAQIKRAGKVVYCVPDVSIVHYENNKAGKKKSIWRIRHFHQGAFRLYRKHHTLGWLDPRTWIAGAALAARGALMAVTNELKPANPPAEAAARRKSA